MGRVVWVPVAAVLVCAVALVTLTRPRSAAAAPPVQCQLPGPAPGDGGRGGAVGVQLDPDQMSTARSIVAVAKGMGLTRRAAVIGLQTAMQESSLHADAVSGDAVGAFQQILPGPEGAYVGYDRRDAAAAARGFYVVLVRRDPGYDGDPRPNEDLAQLVQASGRGADAYAHWTGFAQALGAALWDGSAGVACQDATRRGPVAVARQGTQVIVPAQAGVAGVIQAPNEPAAIALASALSQLGVPYAWGGGNAEGPSRGISDQGGEADQHGDFNKIGFDCSGLTLYAWAQAGVALPRTAAEQMARGQAVLSYAARAPGDLLFRGSPPHHVALYLGAIGGSDYMVEAPQSGEVVHVTRVSDVRDQLVRPAAARGRT